MELGMTKNELYRLLEKRVMILDGATGTELQKRGLPSGICPEKWVIENAKVIQEIQKAYFDAGSDIVYSCTFGCNRLKLEEFGLGKEVYEMNKRLAEISKEAAFEGKFVAGDMAPTGQFVEPFGELSFEECVNIYKEQAKGLHAGGVDLFVVETMIDIQELRAAIIAIREVTDLPILATMTFGEDGYTLTGTDPLTALITLQSLGVSVFGCNCSTGPDKMLEVVRMVKPYAEIPILAKPNAGLPKLINGKTVFDMKPQEFGQFVADFVEAGVNLMGGCCGTSPEYISQIVLYADKKTPKVWIQKPEKGYSCLSSARSHIFFKPESPVKIIGERINPTGKKKFQESLRAGKVEEIKRFALEQEESGADLLDVNMGMSGIDEVGMMVKAVKTLSTVSKLPIVIDSSDPAVIAEALRIYPGRALINSISLETVKQPLLEIAAKYGAMFVLLPLTDEEIPAKAEGRIRNVEILMKKAAMFGFTKKDVVIDGIVMTVSSEQGAALETLDFIRWCSKVYGVNTTLGLSNVSFGLPERRWVNGSFLSMCIYNGLSTAIANPNEEVLMNLKYASDVITQNDEGCRIYVERVVKGEVYFDKSRGEKKDLKRGSDTVFDCVVNGDREIIVDRVQKMLSEGISANEIMNEHLIPGINRVGELYEEKVYFLPQLIAGAEAMKVAFTLLEKLMGKEEGDRGTENNKMKVILATVKGDIHDIGKNIVGIMLKNYGFDVVDLGKDVDSELIVDTAIKENAAIIGLSALMTTTMVHMKDVVRIAKEKGAIAKIIIGGAVTTPEYAQEIGADGHSKDGLDAVRVSKRLLGIK